ncbi:unnamed protein product [Effrenium voratum]|nr:unnamed protein product [Effrenium voratum]
MGHARWLLLTFALAAGECHYDPESSAACGLQCKLQPRGRARADCAVSCLIGRGLYGHCAGCFGVQVDCSMSNCFYICPTKPNSTLCRSCLRQRCRLCADDSSDAGEAFDEQAAQMFP